jgi:curved DNA-binding protein CbpA
MNLYQALGVSVQASNTEVRKAYRKLSAKHHPDKEGGDRDTFEQIKLAYDVLIDPKRRKRYDATGRTDEDRITPERIQLYINEMVKAVVEAERPDGSTDNPDGENIKDKMILSLKAARAQIRNDRRKFERRLKRSNTLLSRFKPKEGYDPVGDALRDQKEKWEYELRMNDDAMQLSVEMEKVLGTYEYDVGPGSEGQVNPGPTGRLLLGGYRTVRTFQSNDPRFRQG